MGEVILFHSRQRLRPAYTAPRRQQPTAATPATAEPSPQSPHLRDYRIIFGAGFVLIAVPSLPAFRQPPLLPAPAGLTRKHELP